jgi:XTP/dITP diphosphohydrolase
MRVVLASNNHGKINEMNALLTGLNIEIIAQGRLGVSPINETGLSFIENALLKARNACQVTGLAAIADDSGLIVPALNGAPGIYSARYAGKNASSADNINKLLKEMAHLDKKHCAAYFHCCIVYLAHSSDPTPIICEGQWHGTITHEQRGHEGFGYDPIFYLEKLTKTASELSLEVKNKHSHRSAALQVLKRKLMAIYQH